MGKTERILRLKAALAEGHQLLNAPNWASVLGVDTRTFQRDLKFLRETCGYEVVYDQELRGYHIAKPKSPTMGEAQEREKKNKTLALIYLVQRISSHPGLSAKQLAAELGCSTRNFYRYRQDLEQLNFPIYNDRGYRFAADAFLPTLGLEPSELLSLILGVQLIETEFDAKVGAAGRQALEKLLRATSEERRPDLGTLQQSIQISALSEDTGAQHLLPLQAVIGNGYQLQLSYLGLNDCEPKERLVDPMGLFGFRHVWYLRAFCHLRSEQRNFRLSRILGWQQQASPVTHPARMSLQNVVYHRWEIDGKEPVTIRMKVSEPLSRWLQENPPHPSQTIGDGEVEYYASDLRAIARWVSGLHGIEVLEPQELRQELAGLGEQLRRRYGNSKGEESSSGNRSVGSLAIETKSVTTRAKGRAHPER